MMKTILRVVWADVFPPKPGVAAVVEIVEGDIAGNQVFCCASSGQLWQVAEIGLASPPHPTRRLVGLLPRGKAGTLAVGAILESEEDRI